MKKTYFTLLLSLNFVAGFAQSILPNLPEYPVVGFEKILRDNPYVLEQSSAPNNTWSDNTKYTWIPSPFVPFKKESKTTQRINNEWRDVQLNTDSFILDNKNRIAVAFEDVNYDYPNYSYKLSLKYAFTYDNNDRPLRIVIKQAIPPTYEQYLDYYEIHYSYNASGQRVKDSTYVYQSQESYINSYAYDGASNLTQAQNISGTTDTVTGTTVYTYTNNKLHTAYTIGLSDNNQWIVMGADTFDYDNNGNVVHAVRYNYATTDGQTFRLLPTLNDSLHYNNQNQMDEIKSAYWPSNNSGWKNSLKYTFNYNNNKPVNGYMFTFDSVANVWHTNPDLRLLFEKPLGVKEGLEKAKAEVSVYPNPASKNVNVYIPFLNDNQEANITLLNTKGESITVPVTRNQKEIALNIESLAKGVYIMKVKTNNTVVTKKILVTE